MTRTAVKPPKYRVPAYLRGRRLPPEVLLFYPGASTVFDRNDARELGKAYPQGSFIRGGTVSLGSGYDTTPEGSKGSTEATVEIAVEIDEFALKGMARRKPIELIRIIQRGDLEPPDLTFAAEAVGEITASELAVPLLLKLIEDDSPLVREGAVYGLAKHSSYPEVVTRLRKVAATDLSPGVKLAADEALDDL